MREQIEADLSYCEIDLEKGNLTNEKLEDITQIRLAKWGRKATLFFGLLSAIGILQLFPNEFGTNLYIWARVAVIIGLIAFFAIAAFKDEIFGLFKRKDKSKTDNQPPSNHTNRQLPSGRQDYIVPNAEKEEVKR